MENDKVVDLLESQDWNDIIRRLTYYANWKARSYTWNTGSCDELPAGNTPKDIALAAIGKVWSGDRAWDPERYPDLFAHLKWIVMSDIGHLFSSQTHRSTVRILQDNPSEDSDVQNAITETSLSRRTSSDTRTVEEELIAKENEASESELKRRLYEAVKGDEDLELLLVLFEDGIDKPGTIATQMGWDITKVYNLKRKLSRKASKLLDTPKAKVKGERA